MGKAGSGKDTILKKMLELHSSFFNGIVSCTTRPPREGEQEGIDYHFLTREAFNERIINGDMLEAVEFNGWFYGTSKSMLSQDKINIGVFNPEGIRKLMGNQDIDLTVYYIQVSDKERIIRQLSRESEPDIKEIFRRYEADQRDFSDLDDIEYIVLPNTNKNHIIKAVSKIWANIVN